MRKSFSCVVGLASLFFCLAEPLRAELLDPALWNVTDLRTSSTLSSTIDNTLSTVSVVTSDGVNPWGVVIDLGKTHMLHRVFFTSGSAGPPVTATGGASLPQSISVYVGDTPNTQNQVATIPLNDAFSITPSWYDKDVRFPATTGRYLRLEISDSVDNGLSLTISELELYGWDTPESFTPYDAVVIPQSALTTIHPNPSIIIRPLLKAANDLSYYLEELTSRPVPVVTSSQGFTGTLYTIVDLKPLATTWSQMQTSKQAGLLPEGVNVEYSGNQVLFKAWPYANVLVSVWEFLRTQGVVWTYPGEHGDWTPAGTNVDLNVLPLSYTPTSQWRYANFGLQYFNDDSRDEAFYFWFRNGWNDSWGGSEIYALGGYEIPDNPYKQLDPSGCPDEYNERFDGYPHNFQNVVPNDVLENQLDWCGMPVRDYCVEYYQANITSADLGTRIPPSMMVHRGNPTFCMTSEGLINFVIDKALYVSAYPESTEVFNLMPMDSCYHCECPRCMEKYGPIPDEGRFSASETYYHFINEVSKGLINFRPDLKIRALAYQGLYYPPENIDTFLSNVIVESLVYGCRYLPMESPANAEAKAIWETWADKAEQLQYYDHHLFHPDWWDLSMRNVGRRPVTAVSAIASRIKMLRDLDALNGGTQADLTAENLSCDPWDVYAYSRFIFNPDLTANNVLDEFFAHYFLEAASDMRDFYDTLEDHAIQYGLDALETQLRSGAKPGYYSVRVLRQMGQYLGAAESAVNYWLTERRVAKIRESYDLAIQKACLEGVDLGDATFPIIGTQGLQFAAADLTYQCGYVYDYPTESAWKFGAYGTLGAYVNFVDEGDYIVTVEAKARPYEGVYPILKVLAGTSESESVTITSENDYATYTFALHGVPANIWLLALDYENSALGGMRNIYVRNVNIQKTDSWYSSAWNYRQEIQIDERMVLSQSMSDFPLLVKLTDENNTLFLNAQNDGDDILFTASDGKIKLNHEIEYYNATTKELWAWVKVPTLHLGSDTKLYVYYGNLQANDQSNAANVWDSGYAGVWHMHQNPTDPAPQMRDSSANGYHGTCEGSMAYSDRIPGQTGFALHFDGNDDAVILPNMNLDFSVVTLSAWVQPDSFPASYTQLGQCIVGSCNDAWNWYALMSGGGWQPVSELPMLSTRFGSSVNEFFGYANDTIMESGKWYHIASVDDGDIVKIYVNGVLRYEESVSEIRPTWPSSRINYSIAKLNSIASYFHGIIDEVRISTVERSRYWLETTYQTMTHTNWVTFGPQQDL